MTMRPAATVGLDPVLHLLAAEARSGAHARDVAECRLRAGVLSHQGAADQPVSTARANQNDAVRTTSAPACPGEKRRGPILVIEPVFPNAHHAPTNAGLLRAIRLAAAGEDVAFAAHAAHRKAVFDILGPGEQHHYIDRVIEVLPSGGVTFRRFRTQAFNLLRQCRDLRPRLVISLGTQPETFFALRLLMTVRRDLDVIAVLHGNLHQAAAGWRSRDPRRRWFNDAASLRVAVGASAMQFVVLEQAVREAALARNLIPADRLHVWPHPISGSEAWTEPHLVDPTCIRIGFLGSAKREKGFAEFLRLARRITAITNRIEFHLIGQLQEEFPTEDLACVEASPDFLDRGVFLRRARALDYVCLPLQSETYTLTVSGAVLDAIAALKPLIALATPAIRQMFAAAPIGFLCDDLDQMQSVMMDWRRLADRDLYHRFQSNLETERHSRSVESVTQSVALLVKRRTADDR
jgi:glycosyltransferase involved in cell wall biosynthesis